MKRTKKRNKNKEPVKVIVTPKTQAMDKNEKKIAGAMTFKENEKWGKTEHLPREKLQLLLSLDAAPLLFWMQL